MRSDKGEMLRSSTFISRLSFHILHISAFNHHIIQLSRRKSSILYLKLDLFYQKFTSYHSFIVFIIREYDYLDSQDRRVLRRDGALGRRADAGGKRLKGRLSPRIEGWFCTANSISARSRRLEKGAIGI